MSHLIKNHIAYKPHKIHEGKLKFKYRCAKARIRKTVVANKFQ